MFHLIAKPFVFEDLIKWKFLWQQMIKKSALFRRKKLNFLFCFNVSWFIDLKYLGTSKAPGATDIYWRVIFKNALFRKASFDVKKERFVFEMALLSEKCPCMQKQALIHIKPLTEHDCFSASIFLFLFNPRTENPMVLFFLCSFNFCFFFWFVETEWKSFFLMSQMSPKYTLWQQTEQKKAGFCGL